MTGVASSNPWGWALIIATLLFAMVLTIVPLPGIAEIYRPDWLLLVLIYWMIALPDKVGLGIAWLCGLAMDVLYTSPLGLHALSILVICFVVQRIYFRLRMFPFWQQALVLLVLLIIYRAILIWLRGFMITSDFGWHHWLPCVVGALIWPWIFIVLRDLRRLAGLK